MASFRNHRLDFDFTSPTTESTSSEPWKHRFVTEPKDELDKLQIRVVAMSG